MKQILKYLVNFLKAEYNPGFFVTTALFLLVSFYINYTFDFEDTYISSQFGKPVYFWYYLAFYSLPYFFTVFAYVFWYQRYDILFNLNFWAKSIFAMVLLSWSPAFDATVEVFRDYFDPSTHYYVRKIIHNSTRLVTFILPFILYYVIVEKDRSHFYGFTTKGFKVWPYFVMLLIMLPLIIWASYQPDFLRTYPTYRPGTAELYWGIEKWKTFWPYELVYGADFINVELFFRGFLVIGFMAIMGRAAVWPMVTVYAYLHFGKPMAEALGSIFGGLILGIIAYNSRSIIGGIIIHLGVAWLMDFTAYFQTYFNNDR